MVTDCFIIEYESNISRSQVGRHFDRTMDPRRTD